MELFRLVASGEVRGDCTAPYHVVLNRVCTVGEFINEVLTKNEWGHIGIDRSSEGIDRRIFGDPVCNYKKDTLLNCLPDEWLDKTIKSVKADGGWSRMDYLITVEEE